MTKEGSGGGSMSGNEYVDRNALRTNLKAGIGRGAGGGDWSDGFRDGLRHAIAHLNKMPTVVEVPRGWRRDELLAAMDALAGDAVAPPWVQSVTPAEVVRQHGSGRGQQIQRRRSPISTPMGSMTLLPNIRRNTNP